jgi:hypothetical protein
VLNEYSFSFSIFEPRVDHCDIAIDKEINDPSTCETDGSSDDESAGESGAGVGMNASRSVLLQGNGASEPVVRKSAGAVEGDENVVIDGATNNVTDIGGRSADGNDGAASADKSGAGAGMNASRSVLPLGNGASEPVVRKSADAGKGTCARGRSKIDIQDIQLSVSTMLSECSAHFRSIFPESFSVGGISDGVS